MSKKAKKILAVLVITGLFLLYLGAYATLRMSQVPGAAKYLFVVIPLVFAVGLIKVCLERIGEIDSGYEDDLDKY